MAIEKDKIGRLLEQIKSGDNDAFDELYRLTSPKAYFVAMQILKNEHDAEDIVQETYITVLEKINEIDPSKSFMGWLYQVISNKSKNLLKKRNNLIFEEGEDVSFDEIPEDNVEFIPEENIDQTETCLEVIAAINELTAEKRICIVMKYFGEMTVSEIAESLEISESTVKNRLHTARKDLKTKFEKSGNVLYGAALGGVLIWALQKTSVTASTAFAASAVSAEILAGIGASAAYSAATTASGSAAAVTTATAAASTTAATTAASTGGAVAAKIAALSIAQKVAVGIAATAVVGGSTAGVVTVVKNVVPEETTTALSEEVTTAVISSTEFVFNQFTLPGFLTNPFHIETEITDNESTHKNTERTTREEHTTSIVTTTQIPSTAQTETTTQRITTTKTPTTTQTETTTQRETTTLPVTEPATTQPTTVPTTVARATLIIEVTDFDDNVVDTLNLTVEAGTEMTWDYLITLVSQNGYEAMAGIYGDGVGAVAQAGETYTFTAEL